jgi:BASS family bile acid:Na+ symporter
MKLVTGLNSFGGALHRYLLPLVLAAYFMAALCPAPGLWAKTCGVGKIDGARVTLPMVLLSILLFNASFGASAGELRAVVRRPATVLAGVLVNVLAPLAFLAVLRLVLFGWHDPVEAHCLLLGLTVVAAMPVAGSSTAWSQTADGNAALSLGLVLVSTALSPVTTPLVLAALGGTPDPADSVSSHAHGTGYFLLAFVVVPSAVGLAVRRLAGESAAIQLKPTLKMLSAGVLLSLCYCNATVALPQVVADPGWDYLALVGLAVCGLCATAFASGWAVAAVLRANGPDGRSLMFGLGMNNNGTGMVLAASTLGSLPWAVVPVLAYTLVQHIAAGSLSRLLPRGTMRNGSTTNCV